MVKNPGRIVLPALLGLPAAGLLAGMLAGAASAQLPTGVQFTPVFETQSQNRFTRPVWFGEMPGKSDHFLVIEIQTGNLWVLAPEGTRHVKKLFWNVPVKTANSMGIFGLAFHPRFEQNRLYYVQYNPLAGSRSLLIEERMAAVGLLEDSRTHARTLLSIPLPQEFDGHQGGDLGFGPDGYLYIGIGDGGWNCFTAACADIYNNGQNRESLLAKMLRIDVDRPAEGRPYSIPADNPFVNDPSPAVRREIWAYGLRNPWRWSFNPRNGDLLVGDVGASLAEEVNVITKGGNYGWKSAEGPGCRIAGSCDPGRYLAPLASLERQQAGCIIGGHVFEGRPDSKFDGAYLFADYVTRRLFALAYGRNTLRELKNLGATPAAITSMGRDAPGNLYAVGENGTLYRLSHAELQPLPTASKPRPWKPAQGRPPVLLRREEAGYRFDRKSWPEAAELEIHTWRGQLVRRLHATDIEAGILLDASTGPHFIRERRGGARTSHLVHFQ